MIFREISDIVALPASAIAIHTTIVPASNNKNTAITSSPTFESSSGHCAHRSLPILRNVDKHP